VSPAEQRKEIFGSPEEEEEKETNQVESVPRKQE
jgi:hypothetical protein